MGEQAGDSVALMVSLVHLQSIFNHSVKIITNL